MEKLHQATSAPSRTFARRLAPVFVALQSLVSQTPAADIENESRKICATKESIYKDHENLPWDHPELEAVIVDVRWKLQRIRERNENIDLTTWISSEAGYSLEDELSIDQMSALERFITKKRETGTCKPYKVEILGSYPENYKERLDPWILPDYSAFIVFFDDTNVSQFGAHRSPKRNPKRAIIVRQESKTDLKAMLLDPHTEDGKYFDVGTSSALYGLTMDMHKNLEFIQRGENAQEKVLDQEEAERLSKDENFIRRVQEALVEIMVMPSLTYGGTGFIYDERTIVTARHVAKRIVESFFKVKTFTAEDKRVAHDMVIKNIDPREYSIVVDGAEDMAVIRFKNPLFENKKALRIHQDVMADDYYFLRHILDYGKKRHWVMESQKGRFGREGLFTHVAPKDTESGFFVAKMNAQGGNSGTPIITQKGEAAFLAVAVSNDNHTWGVPLRRSKILKLMAEADGDLEKKAQGEIREIDCHFSANPKSMSEK